jgi:hypothetical protein
MEGKMRKILLVLLLVMLAGCAAKKRHPAAIGAEVFTDKNFAVIDIPSHGAIGDGLAIAVGGGANTSNVRDTLLDVQKKDAVKQVLVTSRNSLLAKIILSNAVKDLPSDSLDTVYLVFAGTENHGSDLREIVEKTGATYGNVLR